MKSIRDAKVKNKRVLVRCEFNCPIDEEGNITEDYRIRETIPTIEYLIKKGAKVILMSHLGKPKGKIVEKLKFGKIQEKLFEYLDLSIWKASDCVGDEVLKMSKELLPGEILLLENLRFHPGEEENDLNFTKKLSLLGDIFVNDAFGVSHRKHSSTVGVPKFLPGFAGFLLEKEIKILTPFIDGINNKPSRPIVAVFGGVKIETKLPVIEKITKIADYILIGGKIGEEIRKEAKNFISSVKNPPCEIYLPEDSNQGYDIGEKTIKTFKIIIKKAKTILWNGPLGWFEKKEFERGTKEIANAIASASAYKVAGGGESLFVIFKYGLKDKFDFLSTGGGAMLDFLAGKKLPGIEALER